LDNLPKIPFYEKIIEPTYIDTFRKDNDRSVFLPVKLKLDLDNDSRLKYASKRDRLPRIYPELERYNKFVHIGQRKLFLSEIQHLSAKLATKDESAIVVYAGSAPTNKAWMEHLMFPNVKFLLVDPNMFNIYIQTYRDSHYLHAADSDIVYYGNSRTNYNPDYGAQKCSIKYFDGEKEYVIDDKYKDNSPADNKIDTGDERFIKHFFTSQNCIHINEKYFSNDTAKFVHKLFAERHKYPKFAGCKTIFWCDIRTNDGEDDSPGDFDILWNSAMMYNWCKIMEPDFAMLKFRTPYLNGEPIHFDRQQEDFDLAAKFGNNIEEIIKKTNNFSYFRGEIYHQAWHGRISTETRLWIDGKDIRENNLIVYDTVKYEETLFYFNCIRRTSMIHDNKSANTGIHFDHCADCALESHIWQQYKRLDANINIQFWINWLCEITTRILGRAGHGYLFPPSDKKREAYSEFLALIGGKDNIHGKTPYYAELIDTPFRAELAKIDTPRTVHPPKLEINIQEDKKLPINIKNIFSNIENANTLKLVKELEKNRQKNFTRRSALANLWHLTENLKKNQPAIVIYFGSGLGSTINILHHLFPKVRILYINIYSVYISMEKYGEFHYSKYLDKKFHITYLSLNNQTYNPNMAKIVNNEYGVKFYDGNTELRLENKYKYLESQPVTSQNIDKYYDYIYTSQNRIFILEQVLNDDFMEAMIKLKDQMSNYAEFKNDGKLLFWVDSIYFQHDAGRASGNLTYDNYINSYAKMYIWLRQLQPDYAMKLFRITDPVQTIKDDTIYKPNFDKAAELGNDILTANNNGTLRFFAGSLKISSCMLYTSDYTMLYITKDDIINNNLVDYVSKDYVGCIAYHTVIQRFSMLSKNAYANPNRSIS
jgi:hypothetical protein